MTTFYISSTFEDLKEYRADARKLLRRRGHTVICMEDYGPDTRLPLDKCLQDVERCDVYVGIVAWRYGFIPSGDNPNQQSMTECEYRHASGLNPPKERLLFLLADNAPWRRDLIEEGNGAERLKEFRKYLSENHTVCFFKSRREFRREVRKKAREFGHARSFWEWLRDLPPDWPWYATAAAALAAAALVFALGLGLYYWRMSPAERVEFKIKYGLWPARSKGVPRDDFNLPPGVNPNTTQCVPPNSNLWDYTAGQWCVADEELLVRGADWGVRSDLAGKGAPYDFGKEALYDFQVKFTVELRKGDDAAWVVRSQKDKRTGYVFKLQRRRYEGDSIRVFLNGWAYTDGGEVTLGRTPGNVLDIGEVYDDDFFEITLTARGNAFRHKVRIQNEQGRGADRVYLNKPYEDEEMKDGDNHFPYGSIGFFAPEKGEEIVIDDFALARLAAPAATPF